MSQASGTWKNGGCLNVILGFLFLVFALYLVV